MTTPSPFLKFNNVSFSYKKKHVYSNFNFEFKYPITGVIGENGAGKTTMTKLITGLLVPDEGNISLNGYDTVKHRLKVLQQIGVLHENPVFPSWARVLDYLILVGELKGLPRREAIKQAVYFLKELRILDRKDDYVNELSAGLRQRFGIAQALIGLPPLLILDEPTANLDVRSRFEVLSLISAIARKFDVKVIVFSHLLFELEKICDAIAILHQGEIKLHKPIAEIIHSVRSYCYVLRGNSKSVKNAIEALKRQEEFSKYLLSTSLDDERLAGEEGFLEAKICFTKQIPPETLKRIQMVVPQDIVFSPEKSPLEELFFQVTGYQQHPSIA